MKHSIRPPLSSFFVLLCPLFGTHVSGNPRLYQTVLAISVLYCACYTIPCSVCHFCSILCLPSRHYLPFCLPYCARHVYHTILPFYNISCLPGYTMQYHTLPFLYHTVHARYNIQYLPFCNISCLLGYTMQ